MNLIFKPSLKIIPGILIFLLTNCNTVKITLEPVSSIRFDSEEEIEYSSLINPEGKIGYIADGAGDRIPDFSYSGYMASEVAIPDVPVKVTVPVLQEDATERIQTAIDYVSSLPPDKKGFRGTVLLEAGHFRIGGSLSINTSGVVLRGSGCKSNGTILHGTGVNRKTLIIIEGENNKERGKTIQLADQYFPVNSTRLVFSGSHDFKVGDHVIVNRPSTTEWIEMIGADKIGAYANYSLTKWAPGDFDINWDRTIVEVSSNSITIDAPITNSLDPAYGGGSVTKYAWEGRIRNIGVENLRCVSSYDQSVEKDENHRWMAITMNNVCDAWVRRVEAEHFVSSAVAVWEGSRRVTIEDCKSLTPVGEIGNFRRYSFHSLGQQILFQRCYAEYGYHAFSVGFSVPGPNAFVQCYSYMPYNFSGAIGGWSTGILFDKVTIDGGNISFTYRDEDGQGGGWSSANSLTWQCRAAQIHVSSPPGAQNWGYGNWAQGYGSGHHEFPFRFLKPESIFYSQLEERIGGMSVENEKILVYETDETTAPQPEMSVRMGERSKRPDLIMEEWIDSMINKYPIHSDFNGSVEYSDDLFEENGSYKANDQVNKASSAYSVKGGKIVKGDMQVPGRIIRTALWRGSTRPGDVSTAKPHLTRFVPGRYGSGLTDNLEILTDNLVKDQVIAIQHFPSLWYERRRDDHARTRRSNADVWTPFYEQPFSRSGEGEAFDRLSKYDLNKWNPWYWSRISEYAGLADQKGLLLIQEHYLQHNIIEEGAHWVDYPWRSANNINNTGFAEPPHYSGDKRVFMAEEFYDTNHEVRKHYHKKYIQKSLENFKNNTNVIHHLGIEYTGPLHFVEFWLDVIREWETRNDKNLLVMLPGTKEVQDAILSDPERSAIVDVVDIRQWHYRKDGSLYAPIGGVGLAQRQYARIEDVGETSFDQIYRAVQEYRLKYPDKAVVYSRGGDEFSGWAVFMAGGSFPGIPMIREDAFLKTADETESYIVENPETKQYVMEKKGQEYIIFSHSPMVNLEFCDRKADYQLKWIDPVSGEIIVHPDPIETNKLTTVKAPFENASVAWLITL